MLKKQKKVIDLSLQNYNSQIELRDKQLEMNKQQTQNYQKLAEEASNRQIPEKKMQEPYVAPVQPSSPSSQPLVANNVSYGQPTSVTPYILEISQLIIIHHLMLSLYLH
jgi:hypothetical protein